MSLLPCTTPARTAVYEAKGQCGGPLKGWALPKDGIPHLTPFFTVAMDKSGAIFWNKGKITQAQFADWLKDIPKGNPRFFAIFTAEEGVDCRTIAATRKRLEKALDCSKGWCGEGSGFSYGP
jgi:hypothetical protein